LAISRHSFSGFGRRVETKGGETHFFMHAEQITDDDWEIDLSTYRIRNKPFTMASGIEGSPRL
jgi:hypothetical protein